MKRWRKNGGARGETCVGGDTQGGKILCKRIVPVSLETKHKVHHKNVP